MTKKTFYKLIIIFVFVGTFINFINIKANNIKINYFFDNKLDESINPYYDINTTNYPVIEGYMFQSIKEFSDRVNLYYKSIEYVNVYIDGNGGTFQNSEIILHKEVPYKSEYLHEPREIKTYLFEREGYILDGFDREFDRSILATKDIYYVARWKKEEVFYNFVIGNNTIRIKQTVGNIIELPKVVENYKFLGFYDQEDKYYSSSHKVENNELTLIAKFDNYLVEPIVTNNIVQFEIINGEQYLIYNEGSYEEGDISNNSVTFYNLESNKHYLFKSIFGNEEYEFEIITKKEQSIHSLGFVDPNNGDVYLIINNDYSYYFGDNLITESVHKYDIKNKEKYKVSKIYSDEFYEIKLSDINLIHEDNKDKFTYSINGNDLIINTLSNDEYVIFNNGQFIERKSTETIIYDFKINGRYIVLFKDNDNYTYKEIKLDIPDVKYFVYNNYIKFFNEKRFRIRFNNNITTDQNKTFYGLKENTIYHFDVENNDGIKFRYYFETNTLKYNYDIINIKVNNDSISLTNIYTQFSYAIIEENRDINNLVWYQTNNDYLDFSFINPNTNYTIFIRDNNKEIVELKTVRTKKVLSEDIYPPLDKIEINEGLDYVEIENNNKLLEYSLDNVNFISSNLETIKFDNLENFHKYYIYIRYKETSLEEASRSALAGVITTLANEPTEDSLNNLYYDYKMISFDLIKGYNYYYGDKLITSDSFLIDDLEPNSVHDFKIIRISDGFEYEKSIKLKTVGILSDEEKIVDVNKTYNSLTINNIKANFTYLIKDKNGDIIEGTIDRSSIIFNNLNSNNTYSIYILKSYSEDVFYYEEFAMDVYVPKNIESLIDSYIKQYNIRVNKEIEVLINKYISLSYKVSSNDEFNSLYEEVINEIAELNKKNNVVIISSVGGVLILITLTTLFISSKRRKKK